MELESGERGALSERVRTDGVRQVRVSFVDYSGLARGRSISVDHLDGALSRGVNFSSPTVDFNARELFPAGAAFNLASPDIWARPDPSTYRLSPLNDGVADLLADLTNAQGEPWIGCPRSALKQMEARAAERGIIFYAGFEPEGYVVHVEDGRVFPVGSPQFATLDGLDLEQPFMQDLLGYLPRAGLDVLQWSEEYGPGQIEVNLAHATPVRSADNLTVYKHAFRALAGKHGLHGTFMPKPFGDQAGSGLHVHLSAASGDEPNKNLFDDPSDGVLGLSDLGRHALAGLLAHAGALTALGAGTVNSYKRFLPGSWAPTHVMYAYASRAAYVRIPERETARRLELRTGDPASNPYLYLAAILGAALDGIERGVDPGDPVPGDVGPLGDAAGAARLPRTLEQALNALEADEAVRAAVGSTIVDEYVKVKRSEWEAFVGYVGEWDRDWYLRRF